MGKNDGAQQEAVRSKISYEMSINSKNKLGTKLLKVFYINNCIIRITF